MSGLTDHEHQLRELLGEFAAAITSVSLYGDLHPRSGHAIGRLLARLGGLLTRTDDKLAVVVIGDELFVDGRPFTRLARQAPGLVRRFARAGIEHVSFRTGVPDAELREFLGELAAGEGQPVRSRPHILVGKVAVGTKTEGGLKLDDVGTEVDRLPSLRDRIALIQEAFDGLAAGRGLMVGNLERVSRDLVRRLAGQPDPLALLAPWEGEERWHASHAHNVCVLSEALALLAGTPQPLCFELGIGCLLHDIGKIFETPDDLARELSVTSTQVEIVRDHPKVGLEAIMAAQQLPPIALVIAFEHHLAYNGTGYPTLARPRRPHPAARLVAVADTFEVLFTARVGRGSMQLQDALAWIALREGTAFDPDWGQALRQVVTLSA